MIARLRPPSLALVSVSVLFALPTWADDAAAELPVTPAAPAAADGAPARPELVAPPMQQVPYNAQPIVRRVDASEPRKITGMVLTAIGIFHGFAGSVVLGTFASIDGGGGFGLAIGLVVGGPFMAEGLILSSIGIPLWVSGARTVERIDVPVGATSEPSWLPSVDVGAGNASATWHF